MNLLLMALIACGGKTVEQTAETTDATPVETVASPETKEVSKTNVEANTATNTPASDEETKETTDQTVTNEEQNTTEE